MRVFVLRPIHYLIWCCLLTLTWTVNARTIIISGDDVNVRSGPGRTHQVVAVVSQNEHYEVLEEQDGWYKIRIEGQPGWISAKSTSAPTVESIEDLIARADQYFRQRQFITPADANAFDLYQEVLQQQPDHPHARRQIAEMARIYKSWAEIATQRGDEDTARIYAERYLFVAPKESIPDGSPAPFGTGQTASVTQPLQIYRLRAAPTEVSAEALQQMLREYQFNHPADWSKYGLSPSLTGTFRHAYERLTASDGASVVADYATNLLWQHSSPPTPVTWNDARTYVQDLNRTGYGGYTDWRLPTIEELASLLEAAKSAQHLYLDATFGATQLWCWSADLAASAAGHVWYISFRSGGIQPHQTHATAFVLAVRTLQE